MTALQKILRRLTYNYSKDPESNVGKLLNITATEIEQLENTLSQIDLSRDIDEAEGETLDRIGYNFQQWRGQATDPVYRILIKSKIARNLSEGSLNAIIEVLSITLNIEKEEIVIRELWADPSEPEPAAIFISVPTESLNEVGFSLTQFGRLCNRVVAAGVRADVLLQGTFAFATVVDVSEQDPEGGFANLTQTTGGYLGAVYDPQDDPDLPM